jgi:hypothetical protein
MSFFMIRLIQNFSGVTLDVGAQPQRATNLLEWKTKRREVERDLLAVHLTLSTKVGFFVLYACLLPPQPVVTGRYMGEDGRSTRS